GVSKVSIVGTGMRTHTGVAERMFGALAGAEVNMKMITTGDIKISVLVDKADGVKALRAVHQAFGLEKPRPGAGLPPAVSPSHFQRRPAASIEDMTGRDLAAITQRLSAMEDIVVSDVLLTTDQGRITIFNLPDRPGICSRVFQAVAGGGIVVDMIVQNFGGPNWAHLSFSLLRADLERALHVTRQVVQMLHPATQLVADANMAYFLVLVI